jgi:hypothetical protein
LVRVREKLTSVLDSAPQKSINVAKIFKKVLNNCKNAGLCIFWTSNFRGINAHYIAVVYNCLSMVRKDEMLGI